MNRWMRVGLGLAVASALTPGLFPTTGYACSCAVSPGPAQALQQAHSVFSGKVTNMSKGYFFEKWLSVGTEMAVNLEVANVWKGDVAARTTVYTAMSSASCGADFRVGQTYLVYTYKNGDGEAETGLCTRTKLLSAAAEDLQALGPATPPAPAAGSGYYWLIALPVMALLLLVLSYRRLSKRRRR